MITTKMFLAMALTVPFAAAQLPSVVERALKREAAKKENEARLAAAEKQKANEEARNEASEERRAAGLESKAAGEAARDAASGSKGGSPRAARGSRRPVNQEQGIASPLHEKYRKQVVFAKADRLLADVNEAEVTTEINLGDPIYFRVFVDKTASKALDSLRHAVHLGGQTTA